MISLGPTDLEARALRDAEVLIRRRALLKSCPPHMVELVTYVAALRLQRPEWSVPNFDPASGGNAARVLFLLEKPGPQAAASGFISIHNNDQTAAAMHSFLIQRGLSLDWCLFANVIPWWDGTRKISPEQRILSKKAITNLLQLLPVLQAVVLLGATAQRAWKRSNLVVPAEVELYKSAHPSPLVRARYPERWASIPHQWPDRASLEKSRN